MSGGFFRGTSADQDTRFSNKQAKLLKTQKFASELENLVDMTKVKMDVMRPWIAHRVTELLGFEDEVLINFIYGLLEEKVVNGKEIQITLTGFMEKNTGKFMKELWTHLLSAQKNASGVPQQFLDAKEEETRKKQADRDCITSELKRRKEKEGWELEQERMREMEGDVDNVKAAALETLSRSHTRVASTWSADEKETNERNGSRGRTRISRSPHSADRSPLSRRGTRSRSISKSFSNSRSNSRSRSLSTSPGRVRYSVSSKRRHRSPSRRSFTPRRVGSPSPYMSPPRRRSSHLRSASRSPRRSPSLKHKLRSPVPRRSRSPVRQSPTWRRPRSPLRRRSRSPIRRRSRSPIWRRLQSPIWRRSRLPLRKRSRSPLRRRSRSPYRRRLRSPMHYRSPSPVEHRSRSPVGRVSQLPVHLRSPSPVRRRSPSPMRRQYLRAPSSPRHRSPFPVGRKTTFHGRRRSSSHASKSLSPPGSTTPTPLGRRSPKRQQGSPVQSPGDRHRIVQKNSPVSQAPRKESAERCKKSGSLGDPPLISVRSPERDPKGRGSYNQEPAVSSSPYNSPSSLGSQPAAWRKHPSEERSPIPSARQKEPMGTNDVPDSVEVEESFSRGKKDKDPFSDNRGKKKHSPDSPASHHSSEIQVQKTKSENDVRRHYPEFTEESRHTRRDILSSERARNSEKGYEADEINDSHAKNVRGSLRHQETGKLSKLSRRVERNDRSRSLNSGSEGSDEPRGGFSEKRKRKRSKTKDVTSNDDYNHDSHSEDRKEAKRRHKEKKRLKKEEKRRRREERRRRKEERRTEKLKLKAGGNASPLSDPEKEHDGHTSDLEPITKKGASAIDNKEALSDQEKLEIELREKALESIRARKGVDH